MLDQTDFLARYDSLHALDQIASQPRQLLHGFQTTADVNAGRISRIVVSAMGGSALAGEIISNWLVDRLPVPILFARGYGLPEFVDSSTLVVCHSFSGSTEETLAAYEDAKMRGAQIVVVASGGKLLDLAKRDGRMYFALPNEVPGRYGVLFGVRAWTQLLESLDFAPGLIKELARAATWAGAASEDWSPKIATRANSAKQLAADLLGSIIVLYGGQAAQSITMKWKVDFNENAKNLAFWNSLPEMNHNEFSGWAYPRTHGTKVVELISDLDNPQVAKRFRAMNRLLSARFAPIQIQLQGKTTLEQMMWAYMLGSFTSAYLGILNQVDIGTLPAVDKLKVAL